MINLRRFDMRKLLAAFVLLATFAWAQIAYAPPQTRVLVYKGTISASNSIFDVNDTSKSFSGSIKACWAVRVIAEGTSEGEVVDYNSVIYDTRDKYYKVIYDAVSIDPCDPCGVVMFRFTPADEDGRMQSYAVGKGKLTKFSNDAAVAKDYVPMTLKGTGLLSNYEFFDPNYTCSGSVTITMTLDSARTRAANPYLLTVDEIINSVVTDLTKKGGWREWPYIPAELH
jgi:hypothetical protein